MPAEPRLSDANLEALCDILGAGLDRPLRSPGCAPPTRASTTRRCWPRARPSAPACIRQNFGLSRRRQHHGARLSAIVRTDNDSPPLLTSTSGTLNRASQPSTLLI